MSLGPNGTVKTRNNTIPKRSNKTLPPSSTQPYPKIPLPQNTPRNPPPLSQPNLQLASTSPNISLLHTSCQGYTTAPHTAHHHCRERIFHGYRIYIYIFAVCTCACISRSRARRGERDSCGAAGSACRARAYMYEESEPMGSRAVRWALAMAAYACWMRILWRVYIIYIIYAGLQLARVARNEVYQGFENMV